MCNVAGYVGTKQAAPILIDMLRRQEGFDSGFYTGIATIHEGKIHYAKVVGNLETLLKETNAAELPGTIGFIHGRTPGKAYQDVEWGHPFTTVRDGEVESALVLNGCIRFFDPRVSQRIEVAQRVHAAGYTFKSAQYQPEEPFKLSDGMTIHSTDVLCQLVTMKVDQGMDTVDAMGEALCEFSGEFVSLYLSKTRPDGISFGRVNFPMHLNFVSHGAYLATTPMAFPEDAGEPTLLPAMTSGFVSKDCVTVKRFQNPPATVAPITSQLYHDVYDLVHKMIAEKGEITVENLVPPTREMFGEGDILQDGALIYRVLYDIHQKTPFHIRKATKPGQKEGQTAPVFYLSL